ncbi:MAG TPA: acyltransferase family protein, partial [Burkholderiales bacterium]|nr:acyltransferase family protein [Burkholderiales bacterium]
MSAVKTPGRVDWIDFGKGFSIIMVVLHHAMAEEPNTPFSSASLQTLDEYFIFLRMPLFFLMAGIFAAKSLREPWPDFIDKKLLNFFYLFVVWALVLYALTIAIPYYGWGLPTKRLNAIFNLFTTPPVTLWFIYALMWMFLITRLLKWIPLWLLTLAAFVLCLAFLDPEILTNKPFPQKMIRLYPFFLLGCVLSPWLQRVTVYVKPWHLIAIPLYAWFCWALLERWGLNSV